MEVKKTKLDLVDNNFRRAAMNISNNIYSDFEKTATREDFIKNLDSAIYNFSELKKNYLKEREDTRL